MALFHKYHLQIILGLVVVTAVALGIVGGMSPIATGQEHQTELSNESVPAQITGPGMVVHEVVFDQTGEITSLTEYRSLEPTYYRAFAMEASTAKQRTVANYTASRTVGSSPLRANYTGGSDIQQSESNFVVKTTWQPASPEVIDILTVTKGANNISVAFSPAYWHTPNGELAGALIVEFPGPITSSNATTVDGSVGVWTFESTNNVSTMRATAEFESTQAPDDSQGMPVVITFIATLIAVKSVATKLDEQQ